MRKMREINAEGGRATDLHDAQVSAVLDHSITLPQGNGDAGPTLARGEIGGERNLVVLDAGNVLDDGFAVRRPGINAEREVSSRCGHGIRDASSNARRMAASRKLVILLPVVQSQETSGGGSSYPPRCGPSLRGPWRATDNGARSLGYRVQEYKLCLQARVPQHPSPHGR